MSEQYIWAERYRPQTLEDVILPAKFKEDLKAHVAKGRIPSFLFYSPSPGTGKTTTAKALCNELGIKPLFINASLNNSIEDIRMKVVQYATTASLFGESQKVVILDECERLSPAAQESLKGLVEEVSSNCSFVLTCNTKSRVNEALRSRCTEVDFIYTQEDQMKLGAQMIKRCSEILTENNITFDIPSLAAVVKKYVPDNRKILGVLQQYSVKTGTVDAGILGQLKGADQETLLTALKEKKFDVVKSWCFENHDRLGDEFYLQVFKSLEQVVVPQSVPGMVLVLNDYQRHHATVPDRFVHFLAMCTQLMIDVQFK